MKNEPIFVIGTGRCGLTPLMDLISYHKSLAWPSQYNNRFPSKLFLSFFSRMVHLPVLRSKLKYYPFFPKHEEAFEFWNSLYFGFSRPIRDLVVNDVNDDLKDQFRLAVSNIMRYQGKQLFIAEYSGWSRIKFFKEIFPRSKFIHIIRDGRAVANSLLNVPWWHGWQGVYQWRWGIPDSELINKLEKYHYSFVAMAGIHWKILLNNIIENSKSLEKSDIIHIYYEDMVKNKRKIALKCMDFIGLKNSEYMNHHIETVKIIDANNTKFRINNWQKSLSISQIDILNDILYDDLEKHGYI